MKIHLLGDSLRNHSISMISDSNDIFFTCTAKMTFELPLLQI